MIRKKFIHKLKFHLPSLKSAWDLVYSGQNHDVRKFLTDLTGSLEKWKLEKTGKSKPQIGVLKRFGYNRQKIQNFVSLFRAFPFPWSTNTKKIKRTISASIFVDECQKDLDNSLYLKGRKFHGILISRMTKMIFSREFNFAVTQISKENFRKLFFLLNWGVEPEKLHWKFSF